MLSYAPTLQSDGILYPKQPPGIAGGIEGVRKFGKSSTPPLGLVRVQIAGTKTLPQGEIFIRFLSSLRAQPCWTGASGSESPLTPALSPLSKGGEGAGSGGIPQQAKK
jgi:hypothetical protein